MQCKNDSECEIKDLKAKVFDLLAQQELLRKHHDDIEGQKRQLMVRMRELHEASQQKTQPVAETPADSTSEEVK